MPVLRSVGIESFRKSFQFPALKPKVQSKVEGWMNPENQETLKGHLTPKTRIVVEVGSWLGLSTRFLAEHAPNATVIAIDHWLGSVEHLLDKQSRQRLPGLYDEFVVNCWDYRNQIVPVRTDSGSGLKLVYAFGLSPDLLYLDASHEYEDVKSDLERILNLFPNSILVGDDFDWTGVERAVRETALARSLAFESKGKCYWILPRLGLKSTWIGAKKMVHAYRRRRDQ